jgi:hypothetical protein
MIEPKAMIEKAARPPSKECRATTNKKRSYNSIKTVVSIPCPPIHDKTIDL